MLALLLAALSLGFLLRSLVFTGFTHVSADDLDGALQLALLEHWRNVFTGAGSAPWNTPNFFHPVPDTLGYNDGYLLLGIVFTAFSRSRAGCAACAGVPPGRFPDPRGSSVCGCWSDAASAPSRRPPSVPCCSPSPIRTHSRCFTAS